MKKKILAAAILAATIGTVFAGCQGQPSHPPAASHAAASSGSEPGKEVSVRSPYKNLGDIPQWFQTVGYTNCKVDEEKPDYKAFDAQDGITFYLGQEPVRVYQYASNEAARQAYRKYPELQEALKEAVVYGKEEEDQMIEGSFLLHTDSVFALDVFQKSSYELGSMPMGENGATSSPFIWDMSVIRADITEEIDAAVQNMPPLEEQEAYLDMVVKFTNRIKEPMSIEDMLSARIEYNSYLYPAVSFYETAQGLQPTASAEIAPETSVLLHYYAKVPAKAAEKSNRPLTATIQVEDSIHKANLREVLADPAKE